MAALLSSPMGPPMRFHNVFDQPSSPTLRHEELPADFDRSFGSSMSISSSCDGSDSGDHGSLPQHQGSHLPSSSSMGTIYGSRTAQHSTVSPSPSCSSSSSSSSLSPYRNNVPRKRSSPTSSRTLGAAMGTELNGRSPGLAAKMNSPLMAPPAARSSPHYMDISPAAARPQNQPMVMDAATPLAYRQSNSLLSLPPGSAMKEDTPEHVQRHTSSTCSSASSSPSTSSSPRLPTLAPVHSSRTARSRPSSRPSSRTSSRKNSPELNTSCAPSALGGGPLGRLFGTNMSLNQHSANHYPEAIDTDVDADVSIDKEPPAKRRPASLPLGEGRTFVRPSLKSAGMPKRSSGSMTKSTKMADLAAHDREDEGGPRPVCSIPRSQPFHPTDALKKLHRASEPSLNQQHKVTSTLPSSSDAPGIFSTGPPRSRHGSGESKMGPASDAFASSVRERHHDMGLGNLAAHATIIESPSPNTFEKQDLGSYFFDPQSPNVSFSSFASGSGQRQSHGSGSSSQPSALHPSRSRPFLKSHTAAIVPTTSTLGQDARSSSFLGKRPNPYSKRSGLSAVASTSNAFDAPAVSSSRPSMARQNASLATNASGARFATLSGRPSDARPTIPAPRRCQSSVDHAPTLSRFNAGPLGNRQSASNMGSFSLMPDSSSTGSNLSVSMMDSDDGGPSPSPSMRQFPDGFDANGSPVAPSIKSRQSRPGLMRRPSKDDSSPLPYGTRKQTDRNEAGLAIDVSASPSMRRLGTVGESPEAGSSAMQTSSPYSAECMPGFGASERAGKILPCFNVKEDGLMRVTPETLVQLMRGEYNDRLESYQIVDCRFGYEYTGGHIPGAINLSTIDQVKSHFLSNGGPSGSGLPPRSQSGQADGYGNTRKPILVFHCEFSAKRAPSMALALRQADRSLASDYPNCHYPEVYILQGGYCGFFSAFETLCEPNAYVQMDDPAYQDQRSAELNGFRKQFARHRSFTYGDTRGGAIQPVGDRMSYDSKKLGGGSANFLGDINGSFGEMRDPRPSESRMAKIGQGMSRLMPSRPAALTTTTSSGALMSEEESSFDDSTAADSPSARAAMAMHTTLANKKKQQNRAGASSAMLHAFPSSGSLDDVDGDTSLDSSFDCSLNLGPDAEISTTLRSGPLETARGSAESPCAVRKTSQLGATFGSTRRPFQRAGTTAGLFSTGR